jgi:hypothetical protein
MIRSRLLDQGRLKKWLEKLFEGKVVQKDVVNLNLSAGSCLRKAQHQGIIEKEFLDDRLR